ncbi:MAG: type II secretion system F family protein [Candidatus Poseidoniales archaeon]|jgi:flagellar protein FlaJ|tara:strand:- start:7668 stop:9464 length:1797 start_codon:yes stop_codon:yes gene_type:complete
MESKLSNWQITLLRLGMPFTQYLIIFALPATILALIVGGFVSYSAGTSLELFPKLILTILFPIITLAAVLLYPLSNTSKLATEIEQDMHMFITRMGILSLGEQAERGMFDILKDMKDYGALANEVQAIETLVTKWHTNLPEAARIVGRQSPSPIWSDFLDRMSFSVEVGQPIGEFMRSESETFESQYQTLYDARLEQLDTLRETFVSLTTTGMLLLVVSGLHLVLFQVGDGTNDLIAIIIRARYVIGASALFAFLQFGAWFLFTLVIPDEPLFARHSFNTKHKINLRRAWIAATFLVTFESLGFLYVLVTSDFGSLLLTNWKYYGLFMIALTMTPFLLPSILVSREEVKVRRRDEAFPEFIRAFGGTAQARSAEPSAMIKALSSIDFGALSSSIDQLEKRLAMRIDSDYSWDWFAADNNSMMVSRFTRVFLEGSQSSGEAGTVGDLVSQSTAGLLALRNRREISAGTMRGVSYGILIAMIIALNITIEIVAGLGEQIAEVAAGLLSSGASGAGAGDLAVGLPVLTDTAGVEQNILVFNMTSSFLIIVVIVVLGFITARIKGGGFTLSLGQMIQMMWVAAIASGISAFVLTNSVGVFTG